MPFRRLLAALGCLDHGQGRLQGEELVGVVLLAKVESVDRRPGLRYLAPQGENPGQVAAGDEVAGVPLDGLPEDALPFFFEPEA